MCGCHDIRRCGGAKEVRAQPLATITLDRRELFCPYLTIEFKDEETLATARQVVVASAMAPYNRYRLKSCALQMSGGGWSEKDMKQMRHYGITFTRSTRDLLRTVLKTV